MNRPMLTDALLHVDGPLATLTLNRHDVRNALTGTRLIDDIVTVADWVNRRRGVGDHGWRAYQWLSQGSSGQLPGLPLRSYLWYEQKT